MTSSVYCENCGENADPRHNRRSSYDHGLTPAGVALPSAPPHACKPGHGVYQERDHVGTCLAVRRIVASAAVPLRSDLRSAAVGCAVTETPNSREHGRKPPHRAQRPRAFSPVFADFRGPAENRGERFKLAFQCGIRPSAVGLRSSRLSRRSAAGKRNQCVCHREHMSAALPVRRRRAHRPVPLETATNGSWATSAGICHCSGLLRTTSPRSSATLCMSRSGDNDSASQGSAKLTGRGPFGIV
jgi:hypothetical protein